MPFAETMDLAKRLRYLGGVDRGEEAFKACVVMRILNSPRADVYQIPEESQWAFVQTAVEGFRNYRAWEKENKEKALEPVVDNEWLLLHEEAIKWREKEVFSLNEARKAKELDAAAAEAAKKREAANAAVEAAAAARRAAELADAKTKA